MNRVMLTTISSLVLSSCGGGGGSSSPSSPVSGSGSNTGTGGSSGGTTQTTTYQKMSETLSGKLDTVTAMWATRDNNLACYMVGGVNFSFIVDDADGFSKTWELGKSNFSNENCENEWFVTAKKSGDDNPYFTFGGNLVFANYAYHSNALLDFPDDSETLENLMAELKNLIPYRDDEGMDWFGADYVLPYLFWLEWGEENAFETYTDRDNAEDVIAFVAGDKTVSSQVPSSGTFTYDIKAVGFYNYQDFVNSPRDYLGNSPYALDRRYAVSPSGSITIDFGGNTVTGDLNFNYLFPDSYGFPPIWDREYDLDAGGVTFSRSGENYDLVWSGSNLGQGSFSYNLFGPDGKNIGGVGVVRDEKFHKHLVFAFVGSTN